VCAVGESASRLLCGEEEAETCVVKINKLYSICAIGEKNNAFACIGCVMRRFRKCWGLMPRYVPNIAVTEVEMTTQKCGFTWFT
jgi:hypothetical protein